ncbi:MAG: hypothetical protein AAF612_10585 [Planctomycetota bacterium]
MSRYALRRDRWFALATASLSLAAATVFAQDAPPDTPTPTVWTPPELAQSLVDEVARGRLFMDRPPLPPPRPEPERDEAAAGDRPPPPPPPPRDPDEDLFLRGVLIIEGEATAFFEDVEAGEVLTRRAGEPLGRGLIEAVDTAGVDYRVDGLLRTVPLRANLASGLVADEPATDEDPNEADAPERSDSSGASSRRAASGRSSTSEQGRGQGERRGGDGGGASGAPARQEQASQGNPPPQQNEQRPRTFRQRRDTGDL